jgi:ribosomal protein S18 acetylase RimI-like enzyme
MKIAFLFASFAVNLLFSLFIKILCGSIVFAFSSIFEGDPMTNIRAAQRDDYEGLCAVMRELDVFHADALPRFFRHFDAPARPLQWFIDALENPESLLLVAEHEGMIVGLLSALVRQNPDLPMFVPRRWLVVDNVAVLNAYQRMGIGRALMQQAQAWAQEQDLAEVELTVWEFNEDAIAFYEELGYTTIMRRLWKGIE